MTFKNESIIALLENLLYSLKNRFKLVLEDDFFVAATYLNFRFKKFGFIKDKLEQEMQIDRAKEFLKEYFVKRNERLSSNEIFTPQTQNTHETPSSAQNINLNCSQSSSGTIENNNRGNKSSFLTKLIDSDPVESLTPRFDLALDIEFNVYDSVIVSLDKNLKPVDEDYPLMFYCYYGKKFPELSKLAKQILCVPVTSVPSENLFSVTGIIQND